MTTEPMYIPEEHVFDVIKILRAGLEAVKVDPYVRIMLETWCEDEEAYLNGSGD